MPKKKDEPVELKLVVDHSLPSERIYANYMEVQSTPFDLSLTFADAGPVRDLESAKASGIYNIPVVAEIVVPAGIVPAMIKALADQYKKYKEHYGEKGNDTETLPAPKATLQ